MAFGDILKALREDNDLTQDELACVIKVTRQQISNYENKRYEPSIETMVNIADQFNVSLDFLCGRTKAKYNIALNHNKEKLLNDIKKAIDDYI